MEQFYDTHSHVLNLFPEEMVVFSSFWQMVLKSYLINQLSTSTQMYFEILYKGVVTYTANIQMRNKILRQNFITHLYICRIGNYALVQIASLRPNLIKKKLNCAAAKTRAIG